MYTNKTLEKDDSNTESIVASVDPRLRNCSVSKNKVQYTDGQFLRYRVLYLSFSIRVQKVYSSVIVYNVCVCVCVCVCVYG